MTPTSSTDAAGNTWPRVQTYRRFVQETDQRCADEGLTRDTFSREVSDFWLRLGEDTEAGCPPDACSTLPWHAHYYRDPQDRPGGRRLALHQGDVYASQFASYLYKDTTVARADLDTVDFIALLPHSKSATDFGRQLRTHCRWRVAALAAFLDHLRAAAGSLNGPQRAWLDLLIEDTELRYPSHLLGRSEDVAAAFENPPDLWD